ncbi:Hypothetical protein CFV354_0110 [Campylobacter fetus subsp. venerealis NCTC 10354]|nr:Hypothetical protein CFV354_0110 [Campylobacter fetus subsp. venerealis NCTC 10354]
MDTQCHKKDLAFFKFNTTNLKG